MHTALVRAHILQDMSVHRMARAGRPDIMTIPARAESSLVMTAANPLIHSARVEESAVAASRVVPRIIS